MTEDDQGSIASVWNITFHQILRLIDAAVSYRCRGLCRPAKKALTVVLKILQSVGLSAHCKRCHRKLTCATQAMLCMTIAGPLPSELLNAKEAYLQGKPSPLRKHAPCLGVEMPRLRFHRAVLQEQPELLATEAGSRSHRNLQMVHQL